MSNFTRTYYEDYRFPLWADAIGWLIGITTLAPLFIFGIWTAWKGKYVSEPFKLKYLYYTTTIFREVGHC